MSKSLNPKLHGKTSTVHVILHYMEIALQNNAGKNVDQNGICTIKITMIKITPINAMLIFQDSHVSIT